MSNGRWSHRCGQRRSAVGGRRSTREGPLWMAFCTSCVPVVPGGTCHPTSRRGRRCTGTSSSGRKPRPPRRCSPRCGFRCTSSKAATLNPARALDSTPKAFKGADTVGLLIVVVVLAGQRPGPRRRQNHPAKPVPDRAGPVRLRRRRIRRQTRRLGYDHLADHPAHRCVNLKDSRASLSSHAAGASNEPRPGLPPTAASPATTNAAPPPPKQSSAGPPSTPSPAESPEADQQPANNAGTGPTNHDPLLKHALRRESPQRSVRRPRRVFARRAPRATPR